MSGCYFYYIASLMIVVTLFTSPVFSASEQQRLIDLVNEYRVSSGKPVVATSYWLTATAMLHTIDRRDNGYPDAYGCSSGHSWSGRSTIFTGPCCYSGSNWGCMGLKPGEISKNRYSGIGYENWVQASSPEAALEAWKTSVAHNEVMLNLNGWAGSTWKAIGAGVCGGFYGIWFSETADPDATGDIDILTCSLNANGPVPAPIAKTAGSASSSKSPVPSTPSPSKTSAPSMTASPSKTALPSKTASPSRTALPSKTASPSKTALPSITRSVSPSASKSPVPQPPKLWLGSSTVSNNNWQTITMTQNFVQPVVTCSMYYTKTQTPLSVRIKNVIDGGNKFDMQIVGTLSGSVDVHCVAIEAGTYTVANNGIKMEAKRITSLVTNSKLQWDVGTPVTFSNSYSNPVVLGQVMTANDPRQSIFYARGSLSSDSVIPSGATSCVIGKQVGEDSVILRANEQIGYIVIEAGTGNWGSRKYEAIKGSASIYGFDNNPAYGYSLSGTIAPTFGINSVNSVLGNDGGYSVFYGNQVSAFQNNKVALAIDEDNFGDAERYHGNGESVGVLLFQ